MFTKHPLLFLAISVSSTVAWKCLVEHEVEGIAQRWLNAFGTNGIGGLANAVTENIHIYDEGYNNGSSVPYVTNYNDLYANIALGPYGGSGVSDVTYDVVFTFHNCDHIGLRWQQNVVTTDMIGYGSSQPAGEKIHFRGTDLLTIHLGERKVGNATTSADLLNYYGELGYDLGVWTRNPAGPVNT